MGNLAVGAVLGAALLGAAVPKARAEDDRGLGCPDRVAPIEAGFGRASELGF